MKDENKDYISGGYYLKARCIQKSKISLSPPHVREIWDWLLMEANHKTIEYRGFKVERGQLFRTYKDIREGLCWYVGWSKRMYNENQTKKAMKFLREAGMIATKKELGGVLITISNYTRYQNPSNYERTLEITNERTYEEPKKNQSEPSYNNKNDKNDKKRERGKKFVKPTHEEVVSYIQQNNLIVNTERFVNYYEANGWKVGKNAMKDWKATLRNWHLRDEGEKKKENKNKTAWV